MHGMQHDGRSSRSPIPSVYRHSGHEDFSAPSRTDARRRAGQTEPRRGFVRPSSNIAVAAALQVSHQFPHLPDIEPVLFRGDLLRRVDARPLPAGTAAVSAARCSRCVMRRPIDESRRCRRHSPAAAGTPPGCGSRERPFPQGRRDTHSPSKHAYPCGLSIGKSPSSQAGW